MLDRLLSKETVLDRVDAYSIYSFYIDNELEIGRAYSSPLRDVDEIPSFALYFDGATLLFKDHMLNIAGDVFIFVKTLFDYRTINQALSRISIDFELDLLLVDKSVGSSGKVACIVKRPKVKRKLTAIHILSKAEESTEYVEFFISYGITGKTLQMYCATEVDTVYYFYGKKIVAVPATELTIAYRIGTEYKIYTPQKLNGIKFLNNFGQNYVEGYLQLKYEYNFCIITKALKEIMFFREHFDWDTVAGKSETTFIPPFIMARLHTKYKYIFVWLDNDEAGMKAQAKYCSEYPYLIPVNFTSKDKDATDTYKNAQDKLRILTLIKEMVWNYVV